MKNTNERIRDAQGFSPGKNSCRADAFARMSRMRRTRNSPAAA